MYTCIQLLKPGYFYVRLVYRMATRYKKRKIKKKSRPKTKRAAKRRPRARGCLWSAPAQLGSVTVTSTGPPPTAADFDSSEPSDKRTTDAHLMRLRVAWAERAGPYGYNTSDARRAEAEMNKFMRQIIMRPAHYGY